ncbi:MAG: HAMP domain-containing protein, partial [Paracoccaceae bacterium]
MSGLVALTILVTVAANAVLTERIIDRGARTKLESVVALKAVEVETLLATIDRDLRIRAADPSMRTALIALTDGYQTLENAAEVLPRIYITENEFPLGEKDRLVSADTGSSYGYIHTIYHPPMHELQRAMDYYDVFLFDTVGDLVYSVFKENDYATNMIDGPWKDSGLARAYRGAMEAAPGDPSTFIDFEPYAPSADAPAAFIARPVLNEQGETMGVLAYQMPISLLNHAIGDLPGVGDTSDGFLVGSDLLLRTDSVMTEENDILTGTYDTPLMQDALAGAAGLANFTEPTGRDVMAAYTPITFLGTTWVAVVQQDTDVLFAGLPLALKWAGFIAVIVFGGVLVISILFSRTITRPMSTLTKAVKHVADGDLEVDIPATDRRDELGELARATEIFKENSIKVAKLSEEQELASKEMAEMAKEREKTAQREVEQIKEKEEADRKAAQDREEMMLHLGASFGEVVEAAIDGEFTKRVDANFADGVLNDLAQNINRLIGSVDDGLNETGRTLERVAGGDLSTRMEGEYHGAFGRLQANANDMIDALKQLIGEISGSGTTLVSSSAELRDTATLLSGQAEQNAASLEETSAALEEMSASIKQVSSNVSEASDNAQIARKTADKSEKVAAEAATSMERI